MLAGVNDTPEDAPRCRGCSRAGGSRSTSSVQRAQGIAVPKPEAETVDRFRDILIAGGVQTITRERRGADIHAACGQLCAEAKEKMKRLQRLPIRAGGVAAGGGAPHSRTNYTPWGTPAVGRTGGTQGEKWVERRPLSAYSLKDVVKRG